MIEYWHVLPVAVLFSTIAMTFGVGGAALFTPYFALLLGLPAPVAVGAGLFIEIFGFSSGFVGFAREKLVDYRVGFYLLCFTVPAAIAGALLAGWVPDWAVLAALSLLLFVLGARMFTTTTLPNDVRCLDERGEEDGTMHDKKAAVFGALGGFFAGLVSTGLGEINDYTLLEHRGMPGALAAGTSVFVVAVTAIVGAGAHAYTFFTAHAHLFEQVLSILVWAVPGVVLGAQLGVWSSQRVPESVRPRLIAVLFFAVAAVTAASVLA